MRRTFIASEYMAKTFWSLGCILAFLGVGAGAFGAHALRDHLPQSLIGVYETGARYQMYHALALLLVALAAERWRDRRVTFAGWCFVVGILMFSGSLYLLATSGIMWLGAVTPVGGVAFLLGWAAFAAAGWSNLAPSQQSGAGSGNTIY